MIHPIKVKGTIPLMLAALLVLGTSPSWAVITDCVVGGSNCVVDPGKDRVNQSEDVTILRDLINAHLLNPADAVTSLDLTNGYLGKYDPPDSTYGMADIDSTSGSWSAPDPVSFITIKASNAYKLWDVMGATSGTFDTLGIGNGNHDLSHMSFWGGDLSPAAVVPIPGAALLFASGLIGLIAIARRKALGTKN